MPNEHSTSSFYLLTPDPDENPLLSLTLRAGDGVLTSSAFIAVLAICGCLLLAYGSWTDLFCDKVIPNWVTGGIALTGVVLAPFMFEDWTTHYLVAVGVCAVFFVPVFVLGAMGLGDVKLWAALSFFFGISTVYLVFGSMVIATIVGLPLSRIRIEGRKFAMPMVPAIAVMSVLMLAVHRVVGIEVALLAIGAMVVLVALLEVAARRGAGWLRPAPLSEHEQGLEEQNAAKVKQMLEEKAAREQARSRRREERQAAKAAKS